MKKSISVLLATIMSISAITVPAFAYEEERKFGECIYGIEYYDENRNIVRSTDEHDRTIYISGTIFNNSVFPLSEAPEMKHTKRIGDVTFSNYISHNEKTLRDASRTTVTVTQVYVGIGASMRSEVDNIEFMRSAGGVFNFRDSLFLAPIAGVDVPLTCDLVQIKTNTPAASGTTILMGPDSFMGYTARYAYLDYHYIRPYADGGRNMDGTWKKGLTWTFEENPDPDKWKEHGPYYDRVLKYTDIHPISVNNNGKITHYQVIVTNDTNFADQATPSEPAKPAVSPTVTPSAVTASPTSSKVYVNGNAIAFDAYNINGNNYFKLRDVAHAINGTDKQFAVGWDSVNKAISLTSGSAYVGDGGSASGNKQEKTASSTDSDIYVDNEKTSFTAFQIDGNNFFKLRDLGQTFNFYVGWDNVTQSITIDTTRDYN